MTEAAPQGEGKGADGTEFSFPVAVTAVAEAWKDLWEELKWKG